MDKDKQAKELIAVGAILIGVGICLYSYEESVVNWLGVTYAYEKPFETLGFLIGMLGAAFLIGGILLLFSDSSNQTLQYNVQPPPQPNFNRHCGFCGKAIPFDSVSCPYCGQRQ